jgi:LemA protein
LALVVILGLNAMSSFNGFVANEEKVDAQWAEVETQYQRRFDLIPNLVETVKGYADFEQGTFIAVTEARAAALGAMQRAGESGNLEEFEQSNVVFGGAMRGLLGYAENYPDLKASTQFQQLQAQLEGTENRITTARNRYNEAVKGFNAKVKRIPGKFWAGLFGFAPRTYFESNAAAADAPSVNFGN